jgi:hypothetical protein
MKAMGSQIRHRAIYSCISTHFQRCRKRTIRHLRCPCYTPNMNICRTGNGGTPGAMDLLLRKSMLLIVDRVGMCDGCQGVGRSIQGSRAANRTRMPMVRFQPEVMGTSGEVLFSVLLAKQDKTHSPRGQRRNLTCEGVAQTAWLCQAETWQF